MPTEANTKPMPLMSTTLWSTFATTQNYKKEGLRAARIQLILAGVVLLFILLASTVLMVIKLKIANKKVARHVVSMGYRLWLDGGSGEASKQSDEDTTKVSDLTYKMPPSATIPASSEHEEPETTEEAPTSTASTTSTGDQETPTATATPQTKWPSDSYPLFCTYGTETKMSPLFPDDGLCDLIFYDSAYKHGRSYPTIPVSYSQGMNAVTFAASRYKTTKIGVAFAFDYVELLRSDIGTILGLQTLWERHVYHFGIVDMPAFDVKHKDISEVFVVLKELSAMAQKNPHGVELPYIVLGAVPLQRADDYASQMRDVYSPTLFISQGHFVYGDSELSDCKVLPPTMLTKPPASPGYPYDLNDAANALKQIHEKGWWSKWLLSVGMKGRWTKVFPDSQFRPWSSCKQDPKVKPFGNYAQVCTNNRLNFHLQYSDELDAMYTVDFSSSLMFMYDDEQGICRKVCNIKSKQGALPFGIAVYDLEYEDYNNNCSARNRFGAFSRLKMVRKIIDYFQNSSGGGDCAKDIPCAKRRRGRRPAA